MASNPWPAGFPAWAALYILSKPYKAARGVSYGTIPVIQPRMEGVTMGGGEKERSDHFGSLLPPSLLWEISGKVSLGHKVESTNAQSFRVRLSLGFVA